MIALILAAVLAVESPSEAKYEVWKDTSGKFEVVAMLLQADKDKVILKRKSGKVIQVPYKRLGRDELVRVVRFLFVQQDREVIGNNKKTLKAKNLFDRIIEKDESVKFDGTTLQDNQKVQDLMRKLEMLVGGKSVRGELVVSDVINTENRARRSRNEKGAVVNGQLHIFNRSVRVSDVQLASNISAKKLRAGSVIAVQGMVYFEKSTYRSIVLYKLKSVHDKYLKYAIHREILRKRWCLR